MKLKGGLMEDLRYNYTLRINSLGDTFSTTAKNDKHAIKNILFRQMGQSESPQRILARANTIYENNGYSVVDKVPLYSEIFDVELLKQWERDIGNVKESLSFGY
jgi:hypothetical protein